MDQTERILELMRERGILRPRDLALLGIRREYLGRLVGVGRIERIGPGLYSLPGADFGQHQALVETAVRAPQATACLLTALCFHEIGTQAPFEVWIAIDRKARRPRVDYPPLRVMRFSGEALTAGVEEHVIEGVTIRVYSAAKTVADCFKYRNKVGLDVAMEALRDCLRWRKCTVDELWRYAKICRVANVMRPYLEAMV
jgi:predicted transcriptional regulator of viral defense system